MTMLEGLTVLESLSVSEKAHLEIFCQEKFLTEGDILFKEGDEATAMYFLKRGEIEISKILKGKKEKLGSIVAEDILGEMALFGNSGKRMATATAKKNTSLITMLHFSIQELTQKYPKILTKIKAIIEERNNNNRVNENLK